jgi:orotidine-5'-phosphate decarboxylase
MQDGFTRSLGRQVLAGRPPAVVGLDPVPARLPDAVAPGAPAARRIVEFHRMVLPLIARYAVAVKLNIAFFEVYGADGFAAYIESCAIARAHGLLVIGDVKRGDIGSTAEAYASAHFEHADAVTLNPLLGRDSIEPFLTRCRDQGRAVFVLVRTSNPSASEFQDLATPKGSLSEAIADAVDRWGADLIDGLGYSSVGAVVGATAASQLAELRRRMPRAWFLLPGIGIQGGSVRDLSAAFDARRLGALVSQSRGILQCFRVDDDRWILEVESALRVFTNQLRELSQPAT